MFCYAAQHDAIGPQAFFSYNVRRGLFDEQGEHQRQEKKYQGNR